MVGNPLRRHRPESAESHVQGHVGEIDPAADDGVEELAGEVETRGRSGDRPRGRSIDGLVGDPVRFGGPIRPVDIRRQRHLPQAIEPIELEGRFESNRPSTLISPLFEKNFTPVIEFQTFSDSSPRPRSEQTFP